MSRYRDRTAGWDLRRFLLYLMFAGLVYWIFATGIYAKVLDIAISWYVGQIKPLPGAASHVLS